MGDECFTDFGYERLRFGFERFEAILGLSGVSLRFKFIFLVCFQTTLLCVDKACCGDDMFCILWTDKCQLSPTVRERGFAGMGVGCATLFCWHVFPSAYPHD